MNDLAGRVAVVPEGVPLVSRLEHPRARPCRDDIVAEQRTERPFEHVRILVLTRVPVEWRSQRTRLQRVMDDGEALVRLGAFDLPDDAEAAQLDPFASARSDRDRFELRAQSVSFR